MKNVLNNKKTTFWIVIMAVIAVCMTAISLIVTPVELLELPDKATVLSMEIEQISEQKSLGIVTITANDKIETVLSALTGARKTLRQSINDYPTNSNYLIVRFMLEGERRTLCLYSEGGSYYIEEPYVGIYKSNQVSINNVHTIYTDNDSSIYGTYAFEECLYMNPLSSYYPFEGTGERYIFDKNSFLIIDESTEEVIEDITINNWRRETFTDEQWKDMYDVVPLGIPEVSGVDDSLRGMIIMSNKYRLFTVDGEIWLAQMQNDKIWSLYLLKSAGESELSQSIDDGKSVIDNNQNEGSIIDNNENEGSIIDHNDNENIDGENLNDEITDSSEVSIEAPLAVKEYATAYMQDMIDWYNSLDNQKILEGKITALTQMNTGTASLTKDIQMWLLEYRLLPENVDNIVLAGGMMIEDGWLTEYSSMGQPLLVVEYDYESETWRNIGITNTLTVQEEFMGDYSEATMAIYYSFLAENEEKLIWEYIPARSSVFPALPIKFNKEIKEVHVAVNSGELYLNDNSQTPNYIRSGKEMSYHQDETILWSPVEADSLDASYISYSCDLSFVIIMEDEQMYDGLIYIEQVQEGKPEETGVWQYNVSLINHSELKLQSSDEYGGDFVIMLP